MLDHPSTYWSSLLSWETGVAQQQSEFQACFFWFLRAQIWSGWSMVPDNHDKHGKCPMDIDLRHVQFVRTIISVYSINLLMICPKNFSCWSRCCAFTICGFATDEIGSAKGNSVVCLARVDQLKKHPQVSTGFIKGSLETFDAMDAWSSRGGKKKKKSQNRRSERREKIKERRSRSAKR